MGFNEVVVVDCSPENIGYVTRMTVPKSAKEVTFQIADVSNLPFNDNEFDFVFSNGVLHHVDAAYTETLYEMCGIMKDGGIGYL